MTNILRLNYTLFLEDVYSFCNGRAITFRRKARGGGQGGKAIKKNNVYLRLPVAREHVKKTS